MKKFLIVSTILFSSIAIAAGDAHGPSSLIPKFVNLSLVIIGLIYFLRKPAKDFFSSKSALVSEMMERAESKSKEAEMMMEMQRKKTESADAEIKKLEEENLELMTSFEKNYKEEVSSRIAKMKEDAGQKIESEKAEMIEELNSNLLDIVIANAKSQIKADPNLANSATKNIVEGL